MGALLDLLDEEGVAAATLVGLSAGGNLAQYVLQTQPERVRHLVLSHCGPLGGTQGGSAKQLSWFVRLLPFGLTRRSLLQAAINQFPPSSPWAEFAGAYINSLAPRLSKKLLTQYYADGARWHREFSFDAQRLAAWPGRVLIMQSADDMWAKTNVEALAARYPGAQTHLFEQGGHHTILLFPEVYNAALKSFLDETL